MAEAAGATSALATGSLAAGSRSTDELVATATATATGAPESPRVSARGDDEDDKRRSESAYEWSSPHELAFSSLNPALLEVANEGRKLIARQEMVCCAALGSLVLDSGVHSWSVTIESSPPKNRQRSFLPGASVLESMRWPNKEWSGSMMSASFSA